MKEFDISNYPNFLDHVKISSNRVFDIVKNYSLTFLPIRDGRVEWGIAFPMFINPFYKYIIQKNDVLTQNDFFDYYLNENKEFFEKSNFDDNIIIGLRARVYRTYPSLVRDLHFNLLVKERLTEALVVYNKKLDVEEGIDLLILYKKKFWGINLYTDTRRAYTGREKKVFRHTKFDNVNYVELPVEFQGSVKCGQFFLYGEKEYNRILAIINN